MNSLVGRLTVYRFWRKTFVIEWSSMKSTKLFPFKTIYVYGTSLGSCSVFDYVC